MTPRRFFYPQLVIEFYHTMTSRHEPHPTALHFSIDGRPGILRASDITASFNLPVVLANSAEYRQWPHPLPREMVRLFLGTLSSDQFCLGGNSRRICFLSITFCGLIFSRFSISFRGEEQYWKPYFEFPRATGSL